MKWRMKLGRLHARYHTCRRTRAGLNGISTSLGAVFSQSIIFSTSFSVIWKPSQLRMADSSRYRIEYGNLSEMERINELQLVRCGMMYVLGDLHIITHRSTGTLLGWGELYLSLDHQCWQTVVLPVLSATRLREACQDMTEAAITIRCGQNT